MRYVDEYRAPEQVIQLVAHLQQRARLLPHTAARPLRIMEVCGGHTHAIFKFGLDQLLPENIEFIHGPGCPVCCCSTSPPMVITWVRIYSSSALNWPEICLLRFRLSMVSPDCPTGESLKAQGQINRSGQ